MGGFLMRSTGLSGHGGAILTTFAAIGCAVLFTTLTGLVNGRRIYSLALWEPAGRPADDLETARQENRKIFQP